MGGFMANNTESERIDFGEFDFDQFDDFDMGGFEDPTPTRNDRNPATQLAGRFFGGAAERLRDPQLQRTIIKKSFPEGFARTYDAARDATDALSDIKTDVKYGLDGLINEAKKTVKPLTNKIDQVLPKNMSMKVRDWANSAREEYVYDPKQAQREEMRAAMNDIFGDWDAVRDSINSDLSVKAMTPDAARELMDNEVQQTLLADGNADLARIRVIAERSQDYNDKVAHRFKEKSLEVAYKTMWAVSTVADLSKQTMELQKAAFEKITKNTALPEVVKIHNSELAFQLMKERTFGAVTDSFHGKMASVGQRAVQRTRTQVNDFFKQAMGIAMNGPMMADMLSRDDEFEEWEPGETQEQREERKRRQSIENAGGTAADHAGSWLAEKLAKRYGKKLKNWADSSDAVKLGGARLTNFWDAMPHYLNDALGYDRQSGSGVFDGIKSLLGLGDLAFKENTKVRSNSIDDIEQQAVFNLQTRRTINEVLPGWLGRIHNEIRMQRMGVDGLEPMRWSFESNSFEETSQSRERIKKRLFNEDQLKRTSGDVDEVINQIDPDGKLSAGSRKQLREYLASMAFSPDKRISMETLSEHRSGLDAGTKAEIDAMVEELKAGRMDIFSDTVAGDISRDFRGNMAEQQRRLNINRAMDNLRSGAPNAFADVLKYAKAGDMEVLAQLGLVERNDKNEWHFKNSDFIQRILSNSTGSRGFVGPQPPVPPGPPNPNGAGHSSGGPTQSSDNDMERSKDYTHANEYVIKADVVRQPGAREFLASFNAHGMNAVRDFKGGVFTPVKHTAKNFSDQDIPSLLNAVVNSVQESNTRDVLKNTNELLKGIQTSTMDMSMNGVGISNEEPEQKRKRYLSALASKHFNPKELLSPKFIAKGILSGGLLSSLDLMGRFKNMGKEMAHDALAAHKGRTFDHDTGEEVKSSKGAGIAFSKFVPLTGKPKPFGLATIKRIAEEYGGEAGVVAAQGATTTNALMVINKTLEDRLPATKSVTGDKDGDGLRDNSWQEQAKRKALEALKPKEERGKDGKPEKEKGSGLLGIIGSIASMLGGFIPAAMAWGTRIFSWGGRIMDVLKTIAMGRALGKGADMLSDGAEGRGRRGRRGRRGAGGRGGTRGFANNASKFGTYGKVAAGLAIGGGMLYGAQADDTETVRMGGGLTKEVDVEGEPEQTTSEKWMGYAGTALTAYSAATLANAVTGGALATGASAVGSGIMAGGTALLGLISAPVLIGAAAVGAVAVGGYLLYKHLKSERSYVLNFRMAQYGFNYKDSDHVSKILELEAECGKHISVTRGQGAALKRGLNTGKILAIFGVDPKDQKAVQKWGMWFANRFKPVYLGAMSVYYGMTGNTNLEQADDKLDAAKKKDFITRTNINEPGNNSPYSIMASPFTDSETVDLDYGGVTSYYKKVTEKLSEDGKRSGDKDALDKDAAKKDAKAANQKGWEDATKEKQDGWTAKLNSGLKSTLDRLRGVGGPIGWGAGAVQAGMDFAKDVQQNGLGNAVGNVGSGMADGATAIYEKLTGKAKDNQMSVYKAFRHAGLNDNQARIITAEVGRENDYNSRYLFGGHNDPHNGKYNLGFISWQGDRGKNLYNYLNQKGLIDSSGKIKQAQESLDAQAQFLINEIKTTKEYAPTKAKFLDNPSVDYGTGTYVLGKNYIRWRIDDPKYASHKRRRDNHYANLVEQIDKNPNVRNEAAKPVAGLVNAQGKPGPWAAAHTPAQKSNIPAGNPLGTVKVPGFNPGGAVAGHGQIYTNPRDIAAQSPGVDRDVGTPGLLGPVGRGIHNGNIPKDHKAVKAATVATQRAKPKSTGYCAKFVADALQAGGYKLARQNSAFMYANGSLAAAGFIKVPDAGQYQIGDVMVWPAHGQSLSGGGVHGHIQIFNGRNWVSDFIQNSLRPGAQYSRVRPTLWRDSTLMNRQITGSVDAKGAPPSDAPAKDSVEDKSAPKPKVAPQPKAAAPIGVGQDNQPIQATGKSVSVSYAEDSYDRPVAAGPAPDGQRISTRDQGFNSNALAKIAQDQLSVMNSMNDNLAKISDTLIGMAKGGGMTGGNTNTPTNQTSSPKDNSSGSNKPVVNSGLSSLFEKQPTVRQAPINLKS